MNAPLAYAREDTLDLSITPSWWDAESECTLVLAQPWTEPELWDEYIAGAVRSYQKYGVQDALDFDHLASGDDTLLFFAAIDAKGRVLAGLRAKGPLTSADDSHAVVEWAGQPGLPAVRKMIDDRVPFGVLEMKTAWVTDDVVGSPHIHQIRRARPSFKDAGRIARTRADDIPGEYRRPERAGIITQGRIVRDRRPVGKNDI